MKDIDFLPQQYREEHAQRRNQIWRYGVVAIYAALLAVASYTQRLERKRGETQLTVTTEQHDVVSEQAKRLGTLQEELQTVRSQAELITYLRHPWPRTQILAAVVEPLPVEVSLDEFRVFRAEPPAVYGSSLRDRSRANAPAEADEDKRSPAQRDLAAFQESIDAALVVVVLKGTTRDNAALHIYLGQLGRSRLFSKVELLAIESSETANGATSKFGARLTVRSGYGQQSGPAPAEIDLTQKR